MANNSNSTPPTHRIAGKSACINKWFASSSKPHWQTTKVAPESLHCCTISVKYFASCARNSSYFSGVSMSILCFVFGLGGSNGHVKMAIFASSISLRICGCEMSLSNTIPFTKHVSSNFPPTLPSNFIKSRFTSFLSKSATPMTALTQISAISRLHLFTIFELNVVQHVCTNGSIFSRLNSNSSEMRSNSVMATLDAIS